jgi:hypothetical protein
MAFDLPLPKVVRDAVPGGAAFETYNALTKAALDRRKKELENKYYGLTATTNALSRIAYYNLMGPQFLAKLMGNPDVVATSPELQNPGTTKRLYEAGMGNGSQGAGPINSLLNMNQDSEQSRGLIPTIFNMIKNGLGSNKNNNGQQSQSGTNQLLQNPPNPRQMQPQQQQPMGSNPGQQQNPDSGYSYDRNGNNVVGNPQQTVDNVNQNPNPAQTNKSVQTNNAAQTNNSTQNSVPSQNTYAERVALYKGIIKEGEVLGTERGKAISDIGKEQLALSNSGVILDRLTGIIQNPTFNSMRNKIPFFQDKQLSYLSKQGEQEEQDLIGDFISTAQAFKASTVNSFKGKALEKEFNLADKIKIDENDTMGVAQGKLRSLKTLKEIAESKNDLVLDLMSGSQHMNLGPAIREANKTFDTKKVEKYVDSILNPQPTEHDIQYMMKKRNLSRDEIVKQLKHKGYKLEIELKGGK